MTNFPLKHRPAVPESTNIADFYQYRSAFTDSELYQISTLVDPNDMHDGTAGGVVDHEYRNQKICWIESTPDSFWLYSKIAMMIQEANDAMWQFDIDGMDEKIQFGSYKKGCHYDWHLDVGSTSMMNRKISIVIQLSSRENFIGGDLLLKTGRNPINTMMDRGDAIVFPSYLLHKVTEVTDGERISLVLWAHGQKIR